MPTQPEQILENQLIEQLKKLGYQYAKIDEEAALLSNLKTQGEA
jgi:type I restriction enzyme R subunit